MQYDNFKKDLIQNGLLRVPTTLLEIKFLDLKNIEFRNKTFSISEKAIEDISSILGFSRSSINNIDELTNDAKTTIIINNLIIAAGVKKKLDLTMTINRQGEVLRIFKHKASTFSNEFFFNVTDRIIDQGNLEVERTFVNPDGEIVVQTKSKKNEFQIGRLTDEVFEPGLSISTNHKGISVDPFVYRLVCSNGMVTKQFNESIQLNSKTVQTVNNFFSKLSQFQERKYLSQGFIDKVIEAMFTQASVSELNNGIKLLMEHSKISRDQANLYINHKQTYNDYLNIGVDLTKISTAKKRNAKSGIKMWDLINGITDFASHNYGYSIKDPIELQIKAGDILCKEFDISNIMEKSPY